MKVALLLVCCLIGSAMSASYRYGFVFPNCVDKIADPGENCPFYNRTRELYTYNYFINDCQPFVYLGCGGSENSFVTRQDCLDSCLNSVV